MLNKRGNFGAKIFLHYTDIVIFVYLLTPCIGKAVPRVTYSVR